MVSVKTNNCTWFWDQDNGKIWTAWNGQPLEVEFGGQADAYYDITVEAKNAPGNGLPEGYHFHLVVTGAKNPTNDIDILGSTTVFESGTERFQAAGPSITLTWDNDAFDPGHYDANIMIGSIKVTPV